MRSDPPAEPGVVRPRPRQGVPRTGRQCKVMAVLMLVSACSVPPVFWSMSAFRRPLGSRSASAGLGERLRQQLSRRDQLHKALALAAGNFASPAEDGAIPVMGTAGIAPQLPYGVHKIKWAVTDGCGNEATCEYTFEVKDCKPPTVVCFNGLSVNIMTTGMVSRPALAHSLSRVIPSVSGIQISSSTRSIWPL